MNSSYRRLFALGVVTALIGIFVVIPAVAGAATKGTTVNVTAGKPTELAFTLSTKSVKKGAVTFKVTNSGALSHDFKVCSSNKGGTASSCSGKATAMISPKGTATLSVTFSKPGKYEYLCTVPGHAAAGMKGLITVS
jgi:uncharacterized cupredoxin-like copper-binding protein